MDIAISGAGVAGPTLAFWLRRAGFRPVLIEQAPELRAGGYVIDFWGVGYDVAERMGLIPEILRRGYQVREVRMVGERGETAGGFPIEALARLTGGRFTSLARGDFADIINRSVGGEVETLFGDSIAAIDDHGEAVSLRFESGQRRDFDLVIGADGLHSRVRDLAFGPEQSFERPLGYHVAAFRAEGYRPRDEDVYVTYSVPGRSAARFALRDDQTLFLFVWADERRPGAPPQNGAEQRATLERLFGGAGWECAEILRAMRNAPELYFDRVSQIVMPAWSAGRVALVGDAAACASLLAGEGSGLAMTEAYVLAGELARAQGGHRAAFAAYERRLRDFVVGKQRGARSFASSFAPRTAWGIRLRNLASRLMRFPSVAEFLIGRTLRDRVELPDYDF